jgi:hypothetical protein
LDEVIKKVKPRYHFAALGGHPPQFWEREPFVWDDETDRVSRFVSLGAFGAEATGGKKPRVRPNFNIVIELLNETCNSGSTHFQLPHLRYRTPLQPVLQMPRRTPLLK